MRAKPLPRQGITLCAPHQLSARQQAQWRLFQQQVGSINSPFLAPAFAIAMSRSRPDMQVAIVEQGGETVAFFSFERHRFGIGKALGYDLSDYQGVVHAPGFRWSGPQLLEACGLAVWEFDHLVGDQVKMFGPQDVTLRPSPVVDLREGWDDWNAGKRKTSSSRMKKASQYQRKMERTHGPIRLEFDSRDPAELDLLMKWKSLQYTRTGRRDRFAQPWFSDAVRELFETRDHGFSMILSTMYVAEQPVSLYLALRVDDVLAGWFPAYDADPRFANLSPGLIHFVNLVRLAGENGVRIFDLGAGEAAYKETFKDFDFTVAAGTLRRPTAVATVRRLQTAPKRIATDFVLQHPPLRRAARETLKRIGHLQTRIRNLG
jgi:CelD/BcsL family acetyltransferase involved in cellulose biosynthesis